MISSTPPYILYGIVGAILVGLGFFALSLHAHIYRRILAWNVMGSGVFLIIGSIGMSKANEAMVDPLPQAIVITGIVVSISATALALALGSRLSLLEAQKRSTEESEAGDD